MPALANITIKKNNGTTDIVWTGLVPSSGDKSPALLKSQTVNTAPGFQPVMEISSKSNAEKTARRVEGKITFPYVVTGGDGKVNLSDTIIMNFSFVVPQRIPQVDIDEAVSQSVNLLQSTDIKQVLKTQYSLT